MRAGVLTIAIAALFAIVGACGSDAPSTAETTALGQKALTQFGGFSATESAQRCTGSTLVERLGGDGAEKVAAARADITSLAPDQRDAVVAALDHCASINGMVALSAQALGITSATDSKVACLSKRLRGKVGTMYVGLVDPKANQLLVSAFDECVPALVLAKALATNVATDGLTQLPSGDVDAIAACVLPRIEGRVGETFRRLVRAKTPAADSLKDVLGPCLPTS
jgi:hypothetical protein